MNEAKPPRLPKALINLESKDWLITVLDISHADPNISQVSLSNVVDSLGFFMVLEDELPSSKINIDPDRSDRAWKIGFL